MIRNTDRPVAYFVWFGPPMGDNSYKSSAGRSVMTTGEAAQAGIGALEDPPDRHWPSVAYDEPTLQGAGTID